MWRGSVGQVPLALALGPLTTISVGLGQAPRLGKGIKYRPSRKPKEPIEIWCAPLQSFGPASCSVTACSLQGSYVLYVIECNLLPGQSHWHHSELM